MRLCNGECQFLVYPRMCSPESPATQPYLADAEILLLYIRVQVSNHTIEIGSRNILQIPCPPGTPPSMSIFLVRHHRLKPKPLIPQLAGWRRIF